MNMIHSEAVVSCYVDVASLLVMILLLLLSERLRQRKTRSMRIFFMLCLFITMNCAACFCFHAMYRQPAPWCHTAAVISRTLWEFLSMNIVCMWLLFVGNKLYGEKAGTLRSVLLQSIPVIVLTVLLIVNLFTGILFTIGDDNGLRRQPLHYIVSVTEFLLFASAAAMELYFDHKHTKIRFLRIAPMVLSVFLSLLPQFFTPYNTGILGFVIGVTLLYFSMIGEINYVDTASGVYNRGYLAYLFDLAIAGKNDTRCALVMHVDGDLPVIFRILQDTPHREGDVIRVEEKRFLMLSGSDSRSTMQYLSSLVEEAEEKHNQAHPESKIRITTYCRMRTDEESAFEFLRAVMDDQEAGDEMRGIVSMITELDRLDKELKLAADIQISMLPMNFSPFPDRTEFDLHAFMTPAKEVGGDFYDFFLIDSDRLALVIADVSGKGIPAALFMMVSKTLIKNQLTGGCDPAAALERVNLQLFERNSSMMFVTTWLAVLELSTGRGVAVNAGHENPVLRRAGGRFEALKYKHNMFVGVSKNAKYENREFRLRPGDCVFVYTDGIPEANNGAGEMFGEDRLVATLNEAPDAAPEALIRHVCGAVERFADGAPQFDDITMLCLRYNGPGKDAAIPDGKAVPVPAQE